MTSPSHAIAPPRAATVCEFIASEMGYSLEEVSSGGRLSEDLGLDFFDLMELAEALESRFSVRIPDVALRSVRTVGDIERLFRREERA